MNIVPTDIRSIFTNAVNCLRFDITLVWNIIVRPSQTLQYARFSEYFHSHRIAGYFIVPMSLLTAGVCFVGALFSLKSVNIENAVLNSIFTFIVMLMTYYFLCFFVGWFSRRYVSGVPKWNVEALAAADMAVIFAVNILLGIFPSLFFIRFFYAYILYVVWAASDDIIPVSEQNKNRYMVIVTAASVLIPVVIYKFLGLLAPNV